MTFRMDSWDFSLLAVILLGLVIGFSPIACQESRASIAPPPSPPHDKPPREEKPPGVVPHGDCCEDVKLLQSKVDGLEGQVLVLTKKVEKACDAVERLERHH